MFLGIGNRHLGVGTHWRGAGGAEYIHRREEIWLFNDDLLSPLGLGPVYEMRSYSRRPITGLMMMQVWEIGLGAMEKEVNICS